MKLLYTVKNPGKSKNYNFLVSKILQTFQRIWILWGITLRNNWWTFHENQRKKLVQPLEGFLKKNRGKKSCDTLPLISVTLVCTKTKRSLFSLFFVPLLYFLEKVQGGKCRKNNWHKFSKYCLLFFSWAIGSLFLL